MSHREKSLTPWITNDPASHTYKIEHEMPTSEQMRAEIKRKIAAGEPLGANHVAEIIPGRTVQCTMLTPEQMASMYDRLVVIPSNKPPYPVYLPANLYNRAKAEGCDMRYFAISKPIPTRKHIAEKDCGAKAKYCGGTTCLPGLNGKCTGCSDEN